MPPHRGDFARRVRVRDRSAAGLSSWPCRNVIDRSHGGRWLCFVSRAPVAARSRGRHRCACDRGGSLPGREFGDARYRQDGIRCALRNSGTGTVRCLRLRHAGQPRARRERSGFRRRARPERRRSGALFRLGSSRRRRRRRHMGQPAHVDCRPVRASAEPRSSRELGRQRRRAQRQRRWPLPLSGVFRAGPEFRVLQTKRRRPGHLGRHPHECARPLRVGLASGPSGEHRVRGQLSGHRFGRVDPLLLLRSARRVRWRRPLGRHPAAHHSNRSQRWRTSARP